MNDLEIQVLCERASGLLIKLVRLFKDVGVVFTGQSIEDTAENFKITVRGQGNPNCSQADLEEKIQSINGVLQILKIDLVASHTKTAPTPQSTTTDFQLIAGAGLTPTIIKAAEERISNFIGPAGSYFVEVALEDTNSVGGLYNYLAGQIDDPDERAKFLSVLV